MLGGSVSFGGECCHVVGNVCEQVSERSNGSFNVSIIVFLTNGTDAKIFFVDGEPCGAVDVSFEEIDFWAKCSLVGVQSTGDDF